MEIFLKRDIRKNLKDILIDGNVSTILNFEAVHKEPGHKDYEYGETNINGAKNICDFGSNLLPEIVIEKKTMSDNWDKYISLLKKIK